MFKIKLLILIVILAIGGFYLHHHHDTSVKQAARQAVNTAKQEAQKAAADELASHCKLNTSDKEIVVSISKQHLWACAGPATAYDSAVITGMQMYPSELTPVGTYHIYAKLTDQTLSGSDFTGHWSDYVNYWMPFLDNQYGTYGFHDLTQTNNGANGRAESDFGNIDVNAPYTAAKHGSHGCVELPLATAKWLYDWSSVGTTVVVQS